MTLKVVSESRVTWATSVPILVFLGLSVLELGPMYATDRQTSDRRQTKASHRLMPPPYIVYVNYKANYNLPVKQGGSDLICVEKTLKASE